MRAWWRPLPRSHALVRPPPHSRNFRLLNQARATGNPRTDEVEGQTPEIPFGVVQATIEAIGSSSVVGLRDRTVLVMHASTGCRIGALASFDLSRYFYNDGQWFVKLHEKNSKVRDIPVRHDLQLIIHAYLEEAGPRGGWWMLATAHARPRSLPGGIATPCTAPCTPPTLFRVTVLTDLISQGEDPLETLMGLESILRHVTE